MPRRDTLKREQDLALLAQIVARRRTDDVNDPKSQQQIASLMGVSQRQISSDLRTLLGRWRAAALRDTDTLVAEHLLQLSEVKREAYGEWERSKADRTEETRERVEDDTPTGSTTGISGAKQSPSRNKIRATTKTTGQTGNPAFLSIVLQALSDERELLGLNKPVKVAPTMPDGNQPYRSAVEYTDDDLVAIIGRGSPGVAEKAKSA